MLKAAATNFANMMFILGAMPRFAARETVQF